MLLTAVSVSPSSTSPINNNGWKSDGYDNYDIYEPYRRASSTADANGQSSSMGHGSNYIGSDYSDHGDEKLDSSEKEFDEDSYIRGILENPVYTNFPSIDGDPTNTDGNVDVTLSEYEQNILSKYMREFNDTDTDDTRAEEQSSAIVGQSIETRASSMRWDIATGSTEHGPITLNTLNTLNGVRRLSDSTSSLSSINHNADTSDSVPDICNSSRPISFSEINALNQVNQNHNHIINDINQNNNNHNDRLININRERNNSRSIFRQNLSLWMGVTSCVWGLIFYFVKCYYFD